MPVSPKFSSLIIVLAILSFYGSALFSCKNEKTEIYESYHPNGAIKWTGALSNGKKTGEWILKDSLGQMDQILRYKNDTCIFRQLYLKGMVLTSEQMRGEDVKHGETIVYYEDGSIESRTNYIMNNQFGYQIFYFEDGKVKTEGYKDSTKTTDFKQYYPNGKLFAKSDDVENGIAHFYDSLGNPTFDVKYSNSQIEDTLKIY